MNESKNRRMRDQFSRKATLINEGCKINGKISGSGDFIVSGEVSGDCNVNGTVSLVASGYWLGSIVADSVIISGHIEGDITATGKVEITSTARITGSVMGEAIAVAEGAVVQGAMKTTGPPIPGAASVPDPGAGRGETVAGGHLPGHGVVPAASPGRDPGGTEPGKVLPASAAAGTEPGGRGAVHRDSHRVVAAPEACPA